MEALKISASDGYELAASLFVPSTIPRAAVLIHSATAVKRGYYSSFCEFLASRGFVVLTYDYRGIGDSIPERGLRRFQATMTEWATQDAEAVTRWISSRYQDLPLFVIGHSFGGQCLGLLSSNSQIKKVLLVGAQAGYWRYFPLKQQLYLAPLWYLAFPLLVRIFGYFPAQKLGLGENLPGGVALEWARWCRQPGYLMAEFEKGNLPNRFLDLNCPIRAYQIKDDSFAPPKAVQQLARFLPQKNLELKSIDPQVLKRGPIGHFGFFRKHWKEPLWQEVVEWFS